MTPNDPEQYRTQIPNIIDDLGLDPFERVLYLHYKRVCGAYGGVCYEAVRTTAQKTKMAMGMVTKARESLQARGLITTLARKHKNDTPSIMIVDIWDLNEAYYLEIGRPSVDGWTIEQLRQWADSVHTMNADKHNLPKRSPDEYSGSERSLYERGNDELSSSEHLEPEIPPSVHPMNTIEHNQDERSYSETKKESLNQESNPSKESKRERPAKNPRAPDSPAFKVFTEITEYYAVNTHWRNETARIVGEKPEDLEFWRKVVIGWTGKYPSKHNIEGMLDFYKRREIPGYQASGVIKNGTHQRHNQQPTGESLANEPTFNPYTGETIPGRGG